METHMENGDNVEMNNMLCDLIDIHKVSGNEDALQRVLRSIYSLLDSNNDVKFSTKLFDKLISVVIVDLGDANVTHERIAKVLDAVRIHARQSPASGSYLVRKLSSIALCEPTNMGGGDQLVPLHPYAGQIMEHFLDDFVRELGLKTACSPQLFVVLQRLLQSELGENRKVAYAIMRKLLGIVERCKENPGTSQLEALQCMQPHWTAYIVIMEQLEKPESNLVLPMLSGHLPRFVARCYDDNWLRWLRILYIRLLENQNTLVVRWTIEYLLMYSTINELRRVDLLDLFLDSTNKAELYDAEDYFLPEVNIKMFVQNSGTLQFLEALVAVSWQSLPLLHWLRSMQPRQPHISKSLLLKICGRIKSLQHENLRYEAQNRMFDIFEPTIESLSLGDYIQFIKALCDSFCRDHKRFTAKIASCTNILDEMVYFDKSVFMMIYRGDVNIGIELHKQMSKLPKVQHGWWRLFSFFFSLKLELETEKSEILKFYHKEYELDIEIFENMADLKDLQRYVNDKLNCESEEEISFVMHRCVDWFTTEKITKWSQIEELNLNPHELVAQGTILTVQRVASLLNDVESRFNDESILKVLMNFLRQYPDSVLIAAGLVKYAATFMPPEESEQILSDVLEVSQFLNFSVVSCIKSVPIPLIIRGIISGSPLSGAKCIEYGYLISQYNYFFTSCRKRDSYINFVIDRRSDIIAVIDELLRINNQMVQSNVIYLENSKDHRIKMRIARALLRITFKNPGYWSDQLWDVVLALDEHENIKYMFECLVARCLPSVDVLLNRLIQLDALESSQQISLISVLHIYCLNKYNHVKPEQLQRIIDLLLPQTMSNDFETRLFTQLILHRLLQQFEDSNIKLPGVTNMKNAIEGNLGDKLQEYEDEGRLLLPKICYQTPDGLQAADFILYMTYAPCDEYFADSLRPNIKLKSELAKFRNIVREKGEIQFSLS